MSVRAVVLASAVALVASGFGRTVAVVHAQDPERLLVMPFENVNRDNRIFWLGEASAVLLADGLNALGTNAITREERAQAFERLQVPPVAALTDATVIRIGQLVGASQVVTGSVQFDGDMLVVRARAVALDAGKIQASVTERGPVSDLFAIFERVARGVAPRAPAARAVAVAQPADREYPPLAAFEDYIKGLLAETPETAINYLNAALALHARFDRARVALGNVYADEGRYEPALEVLARVPADSPWARRARFLAGVTQLNLNRYADAFATFKGLADEQPTAAVLSNLGVVQMRRQVTPQTGEPTFYFSKATDADPNDPDYFFNLGYAYWTARDQQAAIYWLREAVRRNPADGEAHYVLGAALLAAGNSADSSREKELARRLSSTFEEWDKRRPAEAVPKGLERIKSDVELPHAKRLETTLATSEQRDQRELAQFYVDRGSRLFDQELDREASAELNRALFLAPYHATAHLLVGLIHLRNGRVHEAIDALKISLWSQETVRAHLALGDAYLQTKDLPAARAEAERALVLDPASLDAKRLLASAGPK